MDINKQIRSFRDRVFKDINEEPLPVEVKRLVLTEIMSAVNQACDSLMNQPEEKEANNG